jgi:hypothetical protein
MNQRKRQTLVHYTFTGLPLDTTGANAAELAFSTRRVALDAKGTEKWWGKEAHRRKTECFERRVVTVPLKASPSAGRNGEVWEPSATCTNTTFQQHQVDFTSVAYAPHVATVTVPCNIMSSLTFGCQTCIHQSRSTGGKRGPPWRRASHQTDLQRPFNRGTGIAAGESSQLRDEADGAGEFKQVPKTPPSQQQLHFGVCASVFAEKRRTEV